MFSFIVGVLHHITYDNRGYLYNVIIQRVYMMKGKLFLIVVCLTNQKHQLNTAVSPKLPLFHVEHTKPPLTLRVNNNPPLY